MEEKHLYRLDTEYGPIHIYGPDVHDPDVKIPISNRTGDVAAAVKTNLGEALVSIRALYSGLEELRQQLSPDSFGLELGLTFDFQAGLFVVSSGTAIDFKLKMEWDKPKEE